MARRVWDVLRTFDEVPVHIYGSTLPAVAFTGSGTDDCVSGGKFTAGEALSYQAKIDAVAAIAAVTFTGTGLDDCASGGTFSGSVDTDYVVEVDGTGTPDTFRWSNDGGLTWNTSTVNMTGSAQTLENGVQVTFTATTGHTVGDQWAFTAIVDTFKWSADGGSTWEATGISLTGAAQALSFGVTVTFGTVVGHTLNDLWDIVCTLAFVGTCVIEATLASEAEVIAGTARWTVLITATDADKLDKVDVPYTYIRPNISVYTSGSIWVDIMV
jgi:hypothetical protein